MQQDFIDPPLPVSQVFARTPRQNLPTGPSMRPLQGPRHLRECVLKGTFTGGLLATVLAVSTVAIWSPGADAAGNIDARAAQAVHQSGKDAARNLIASRAPQLKVSANEKFTLAQPVISSEQGLQYAAYERTYKGLPVVGGDFVVTSNTRGQILGTSVAQKARIGKLSIAAKVSKAAASRAAKRELTDARQTLALSAAIYASAFTDTTNVDSRSSSTTGPSSFVPGLSE